MIEDLYDIENILSQNDDLLIISENAPSEPMNVYLKFIWEEDKKFINIIPIKNLQFNSNQIRIDLNAFENGIYLLEIQTENTVLTKKIIKK